MSEKEMIYHALTGWVKYVETGNFSGMDRDTIIQLAANDKDMKRVANKLPTLTTEQIYFINKLRELSIKVLNNGVEVKK